MTDDSSELESLRAKVKLLEQQLTETQRLATIGTISAVIAHEFNNILTPIINYSQLGLKETQKPTPDFELIKKALAKSSAGSEKAAKICASMLALARGESASDNVDLRNVIEEVLAVLARDPQKDGIALRVQVPPGLAVKGDPVQIEQVLLNLLINARQAMLGKGGSLTVKAAPDDSGIKIQVIDTGPGIPEKLLPKIFQPFFTTKGTAKRGETKGTGLGLSICQEIVNRHGGKIEVASEVGKGTTFSILLPAA